MRRCANFLTQYLPIYFFFFFNDTATTEIYTLSLHDALPIYWSLSGGSAAVERNQHHLQLCGGDIPQRDRKSTRLNSSHGYISYAVFCLKKKNDPTRYGLHVEFQLERDRRLMKSRLVKNAAFN